MGKRIDVEAVKAANPLEAVLARHGVELSGGMFPFKARCPFHAEDTPSFYLYEDHYHCFGCGAHGHDAIAFVRAHSGLDFRDACEELMGAAGVPETAAGARAAGPAPRRKPLPAGLQDAEERNVMAKAVELYRNSLLAHPAALAYAMGRGVGRDVLDRLHVGYCKGGQLAEYLRMHRVQLAIARRIGLFRWDTETRTYTETFVGRVVVPEMRDGKPVWLVGRPIQEGSPPKYLGLPLRPREGLPKGASKPLLGWEEARGHEVVYLCEGVFDRLVLSAWGKPALGLAGTGVPDRIVGALCRFRRVYVVLDSDEAGREATRKVCAALQARAVPVALEGAKDVAELALEPDGRERFERAVAAAVTADVQKSGE